MGQVNQGLKNPFYVNVVQLVQKEGKGNRNNNTAKYLEHRDIQGIPDGADKMFLGEDLPEIRETGPGRREAPGYIIALKGYHHPVKGDIGKDEYHDNAG
jgi:hypothetical protein